MLLLDALFRFSGLTMLFMIALVALRDSRSWQSTPYLVVACTSVSALFLGYTLEPLRPPAPLYEIVRFWDPFHLVFVWLFALSLFQKDFKLNALHILAGGLYVVPILWIRLAEFGWAPSIPTMLITYVSVTSLIIAGHLVFETLRERADDLSETRRASRLYFVLLVAGVTVLAAITEPLVLHTTEISSQTLKVLSIWPAILAGTIWLVRIKHTPPQISAPDTPRLSASDKALKVKLDDLMVNYEAYKDSTLSITGLANSLGATQHRLRQLINQSLGYENFSTFVNTYRIQAVKALLEDEAHQHLPLQTLALQCGFQSLSPFNRAFKAQEGIPPSRYRHSIRND